jgi:hypothetical protein
MEAHTVGSCIPSFVRAEVEFLERSVRLQRRAFNFRRGVTNASPPRGIIAAMLRHDELAGTVGTKRKASNERVQRRVAGEGRGARGEGRSRVQEAAACMWWSRGVIPATHSSTAPKTTQHTTGKGCEKR